MSAYSVLKIGSDGEVMVARAGRCSLAAAAVTAGVAAAAAAAVGIPCLLLNIFC